MSLSWPFSLSFGYSLIPLKLQANSLITKKQLMKLRIMALLSLFLFALPMMAQIEVLPPPKEVEKEFRKEYRQNLRDDKRTAPDTSEWDIVLPPEERVPIQLYNELPPSSADNWGVRILMPPAVRERLLRECKFPGILKVADTGESDHSDTQAGRVAGTNYTATSSNAKDEGGHGTHVLGIAAAKNFGLMWPLFESGLWKHKSIKVLDKSSGQFSWYANGINTERTEDEQLIRAGNYVVWNSSLGGGTQDVPIVEDALKRSYDLGVIFVAATGNNNGPVSYPGRSRYGYGVASLDQNLRRSSYSNYGPQVTLAMPGRSITSTYLNGSYATLSGTSMASPFAAALSCIALAKWGNKVRNPERLRDYIEAVCTDLGDEGHDDFYGAGIAYVIAVLDNDPDKLIGDEPGNPNPPPPPPPAPPTKEQTISIHLDNPIVFRYRTSSENRGGLNSPICWRIVTLEDFELSYTSRATAADAKTIIEAQFRKYFYETGKVMVIDDADTAYDVMNYIPMFFYYYTRDEGFPIRTAAATGTDEQGNTYQLRYKIEQRGGVPTLDIERPRAKVLYH